MEKVIKESLKASPGLSASKIQDIYIKDKGKDIKMNIVYMHLRKLKSKGVIINQGGRWYLK